MVYGFLVLNGITNPNYSHDLYGLLAQKGITGPIVRNSMDYY